MLLLEISDTLGRTCSEEYDRGCFGVESVWVSGLSWIHLVFLLQNMAVKVLCSCEPQPEGWENSTIIKGGIVVQYVQGTKQNHMEIFQIFLKCTLIFTGKLDMFGVKKSTFQMTK